MVSSLTKANKEEKSQVKQDEETLLCHSQTSAFTKVQPKSQTSLSDKETLSQGSEEYKTQASPPKRRRRKTKELDIRKNLVNLRLSILSGDVIGFFRSPKKAIGYNKTTFKRRSRYIGVSRNNANWQAMVNVGHVKKYIGTYREETQAARAYDLYSVALRGEDATLNFDYNASEMLERIEYFLENNSVKFNA
eukprot:CAMPEP_0196996382 /NCGR_PEP_ID=MMETSP1380-20130617/2274_1 /TAXON_ID=5936 /ORGANISM="Euplotes crassus, Strain CT5" /LENGTH=191 /DNA_ID=CAMNT_0042412325 /DNA_START=163 /DNA_END=738 /DNA_ORIENTATION=-